MALDKIYIQMYSFLDGSEYDTKAFLKAAAEMGYAGPELFGPNMEIPANEMKAYLDSLGLEAISMHCPDTDAVEGLIPYAAALGMKFIGIGMEAMRKPEDVHTFAEKLNMLGGKCAAAGLTLTYHNHTQEFAVWEGSMIFDTLMAETDPDHVSFELDAGWCAAAGVDPIAYIKASNGRIKLIHIKESEKAVGPQPPFDFDHFERDESGMPILDEETLAALDASKKLDCHAGKGLVDWAELRRTADACGVQAYIVEREYTDLPTRREALEEDFNYYSTVM